MCVCLCMCVCVQSKRSNTQYVFGGIGTESFLKPCPARAGHRLALGVWHHLAHCETWHTASHTSFSPSLPPSIPHISTPLPSPASYLSPHSTSGAFSVGPPLYRCMLCESRRKVGFDFRDDLKDSIYPAKRWRGALIFHRWGCDSLLFWCSVLLALSGHVSLYPGLRQ